jgi:hypothetical protein
MAFLRAEWSILNTSSSSPKGIVVDDIVRLVDNISESIVCMYVSSKVILGAIFNQKWWQDKTSALSSS